MKPHLYGLLLVHEKEGRLYNGGKDSFFNKRYWETGQLHAQESNWITLSHHAQTEKLKMD